ncbi:MAG: hypothetical protein L0Z53_04110 [Acidobacteriales bacterium]|nr:hypothetical protein [Terriglobales bacterium]
MSRMSVDDHYDNLARGARIFNATRLEWDLLYIEFRRADNHFTNWLLDLREPDAIGFQQRIALLEEKAQMVSESDRKAAEYIIRRCKKDYYRRFPQPGPTLRQLFVLAGKKVGAFVRGLASRGSK